MSKVKNKLKSQALKTDARRLKEDLERRRLGNQPAIKHFTESLEALKLKYEQFFLGIEKFAPTEEHARFKSLVRQMKLLLHKTSEDNFRINNIEQKYLTLNNLWEKSLRQKESGTYRRDLFRAKIADDLPSQNHAQSSTETIESHLVDKIFDDFKTKNNLDLGSKNSDKLKRILLIKIKELKKKHNNLDFSIEIAIKDGKLGLCTKS